MTDNTNNYFHTTINNSNQSNSNINPNSSGYTIVYSDADPTKFKLKRNLPSTSTSLYHVVPGSPQFCDSHANQVTNGSSTLPCSTTSTLTSNKQMPVFSTSNFGNSNAATTGSSSHSWHTPSPYPQTSLAAAGSSSSSSSLSSCSSIPAASSSPVLRYDSSSGSSSNNYYTRDLGQSSSTITAVHGSTIGSQIPFSSSSYLAGNSIAGNSMSSLYSSYNDNIGPSVSTTSTSSNLPPSLASFSSSAPPVNNFFFGLPQNQYIPSPMAAPIATPMVNSMIPQNVITQMATPTATSMTTYVSPQLVRVKRTRLPKQQPNYKKPRGRPKKSATSDILPTGRDYFKTLLSNLPRPPTNASSTVTTKRPTSTITSMPATSTYIPPPSVEIYPIPRPIVTAKPPMPPNWLENNEDTIMSLFTFKKYTVSPSSLEYQTITNMLDGVKVKGIEQVVNPDLWKRFVNTRKEMLRSKTDDLNILPKLGLDEREVLRCAHLSLNYNKDPLITDYSDNMALLFHCTRNQTSLNNILSQGLDERLSNIGGGLLGKGIYFADDPQKSLQYDGTGCILIFAVLLGDCISVDHFPNKNALVREPEKVQQQKRNFNDQFFDSIVARPANYNEYVIYNRYQCCPLYQIEYERSAPVSANTWSGSLRNNFKYAAQILPPLAWVPEGPNYAMPVQKQNTQWPFYAVDIFSQMGVAPPMDEESNDQDSNNPPVETTPQMSIDEKLATLINLGFYDEDRNKAILCKFNNDLDQTVNYFLDNDNVSDFVEESNQPSTSLSSEAQIYSVPSSSSSSPTLPALSSSSSKNLPSSSKGLATTASMIISSTSSNLNSIPSTSGTSTSTTLNKSLRHQSIDIVTIDLLGDDSACSDVEEITTNKTCNEGIIVDPLTELPEDIADWAIEYDADYLQEEIKVSISLTPPEMEDCLICYSEYESLQTSPSSWQELECSHKLCLACYSNILTTRTTMSGIQHTFVKCPFCQGTTGIEVGTCPDLDMNVTIIPNSCESYEGTNTISINYSSSVQRFNRTAYLPNNTEGQEVVNLLRIACDRRLCFTIGTSVTTGQENVIVWNIHHKTAMRGGVSSYGYPDPSYMERVKYELKAFGIE